MRTGDIPFKICLPTKLWHPNRLLYIIYYDGRHPGQSLQRIKHYVPSISCFFRNQDNHQHECQFGLCFRTQPKLTPNWHNRQQQNPWKVLYPAVAVITKPCLTRDTCGSVTINPFNWLDLWWMTELEMRGPQKLWLSAAEHLICAIFSVAFHTHAGSTQYMWIGSVILFPVCGWQNCIVTIGSSEC